MSNSTVVRVGKRGTVVIPAALRVQLELEEGALLLAEAHPDGLLLRPAMAVPRRLDDAKAQAHHLLTTAHDLDAYVEARAAVRRLGIDPASIPHAPPTA